MPKDVTPRRDDIPEGRDPITRIPRRRGQDAPMPRADEGRVLHEGFKFPAQERATTVGWGTLSEQKEAQAKTPPAATSPKSETEMLAEIHHSLPPEIRDHLMKQSMEVHHGILQNMMSMNEGERIAYGHNLMHP